MLQSSAQKSLVRGFFKDGIEKSDCGTEEHRQALLRGIRDRVLSIDNPCKEIKFKVKAEFFEQAIEEDYQYRKEIRSNTP